MRTSLLGLRTSLAIGLALLPLVALAQDPVKIAPEVYKVAIENADVRALDTSSRAGRRRYTRTPRRC